MNRLVRLGPYVTAVAVSAAIFLLFMPARAPQEEVTATEGSRVELQRTEELERRRHCCARRQQIRDQVITELIAGRLDLLQAAERFRALNEADPHFCWHVWRRSYPGASDDERCCRQIIAFVRIDLEDGPAQARSLGERLEKELDDYLENGSFPEAL